MSRGYIARRRWASAEWTSPQVGPVVNLLEPDVPSPTPQRTLHHSLEDLLSEANPSEASPQDTPPAGRSRRYVKRVGSVEDSDSISSCSLSVSSQCSSGNPPPGYMRNKTPTSGLHVTIHDPESSPASRRATPVFTKAALHPKKVLDFLKRSNKMIPAASSRTDGSVTIHSSGGGAGGTPRMVRRTVGKTEGLSVARDISEDDGLKSRDGNWVLKGEAGDTSQRNTLRARNKEVSRQLITDIAWSSQSLESTPNSRTEQGYTVVRAQGGGMDSPQYMSPGPDVRPQREQYHTLNSPGAFIGRDNAGNVLLFKPVSPSNQPSAGSRIAYLKKSRPDSSPHAATLSRVTGKKQQLSHGNRRQGHSPSNEAYLLTVDPKLERSNSTPNIMADLSLTTPQKVKKRQAPAPPLVVYTPTPSISYSPPPLEHVSQTLPRNYQHRGRPSILKDEPDPSPVSYHSSTLPNRSRASKNKNIYQGEVVKVQVHNSASRDDLDLLPSRTQEFNPQTPICYDLHLVARANGAAAKTDSTRAQDIQVSHNSKLKNSKKHSRSEPNVTKAEIHVARPTDLDLDLDTPVKSRQEVPITPPSAVSPYSSPRDAALARKLE